MIFMAFYYLQKYQNLDTLKFYKDCTTSCSVVGINYEAWCCGGDSADLCNMTTMCRASLLLMAALTALCVVINTTLN